MKDQKTETEQRGSEPEITSGTTQIGFTTPKEGKVNTDAEPDNAIIFNNSNKEKLRRWHNLNSSLYLDLVRAQPIPWPVSMYDNRCHLSYLIVTTKRETLPDHRFESLLDQVCHDVDTVVNTGWSMFLPLRTFQNIGMSPFRPEGPGGEGEDVYEQNLITQDYLARGLPDFWRISLDGRASLVRMYVEDRMQRDIGGNPVPERWLDPETVICDTTELVIHATALAKRFQSAVGIGFILAWTGLKNRRLHSMDPAISWSFAIAQSGADSRFIEKFYPLPSLESDWTTIVSELSAPVLRLFNFTACTPELVARISPRFKKL